ncbi:mitochondrial carrier [Gymnopus androsaceus JB14]|uniref:Mitochondrial carrier n=1 Tax=Gymnopus androsaceus JB14 TaxID=1447944 RepID=A0A6A4GIB1_9AGAR|nr:mitochondrial carrier [Gymnopus androsaceus JB14]
MMNIPTPARVPPIHVPIALKSPLKNLSSASIYVSPHPPLSAPASGTNLHLPGPLSIAHNVIVTNGIRGLWLGHTGTVLRETGGTAVWFSVKEWVAKMLRDRREKAEHGPAYLVSPERRPSALLPWESAFAGAISGAVCVAVLYPADTVKSAMQTEEELREMRAYQKRASSAVREWSTSTSSGPSLAPSSSSSSSTAARKPTIAPNNRHITTVTNASIKSVSFLQTFLKIYRTHGAKGLYSRCGMSIARAIPSSGIVFLVYDGLTAWFNQPAVGFG